MRRDLSGLGAAVFGGFDGLVSVLGVLTGMLIQHAARPTLIAAVVGGAICATLSMGAGQWLSDRRTSTALVMGAGTAVGTVLPLLPYLLPIPEIEATVVSAILVLAAAGVIAWIRPGGMLRSVVETYGLLITAVAVTIGVVILIPASAG